MPKRNNSDDDTAEIKAMFVEIKGSNATIQETLKAIATTFKPTVVQQILPLPQRQNDALPSDTSSEDMVDFEEVGIEEPTVRQKTRVGTRKNPRPPKPVDIDITSGDMPLKTYVQQKGPKSHSEKYMLLTSWLQNHRGQESVTMADIYTCYRLMSWSTPKDTREAFRADAFSKIGNGRYALSSIGENKVLEMGQAEE